MVDDTEFMLTTVDNPFDPFTQYDEWYAWDYRAGYHTPGALARQVATSNDMSEADQSSVINDAIDELVNENYLGIYQKVSRAKINN